MYATYYPPPNYDARSIRAAVKVISLPREDITYMVELVL